jgi:hypothetical protein
MTKNNFINKIALIFVWPVFCLVFLFIFILSAFYVWIMIPLASTEEIHKYHKCITETKKVVLGEDDEKEL